MAVTLSEIEGRPERYLFSDPARYPPFSILPDEIDEAVLWRRVEAYIAYRFAPRETIYTVAGPGCWRPRLRPFTIDLVERWGSDGWTEAEVAPEPLGGVELTGGTYRITCTVGTDAPVPADVVEALRRLAEYQAEIEGGAASIIGREEVDLGGVKVASERPVAWPARAMQLSGAADLLRPYRDLGAAAWE